MIHRWRLSLQRLLLAGLLALTAIVGGVGSAEAESWCQADPVVLLNGKDTVQILFAVPRSYEKQVVGATLVDIRTPLAIKRELLSVDNGINNQGEVVVFGILDATNQTTSQYRVTVRVIIPMQVAGSVPTRVTINATGQQPVVVYGTNLGTDVSLWLNR